MLVQVGDGKGLATVRTLGTLIVMNLSDVSRQVGHGKLLLTMWTRLLDLQNNKS